jgi:hypothetical protein
LPDRIRIGVFTLRDAQVLQHIEAAHVRQVQVQQDDVVVIELAEIDAFFAKIRRVDVTKPSDFSINSIDCAVALSSSTSKTRIQPLPAAC